MILMIFASLLILGIVFFQVVQGLFSALIMTLLTILSAAIAFNTYEMLAAELYAFQPAHADSIALLAMFILPLLGLRWLYDFFLGGNVVFGVWADRIGGGVLGVVTGMVMVGVFTIAVQMLPLGRSILGYEPFDPALQRQDTLAPFYPDDFTLGLVEKLSVGSFKGEQPFTKIHDNLLRELYCARNTAGYNAEITSDTSDIPNWMKVLGVYRPGAEELQVLGDLPPNPLLPKSTLTRVVIVRTSVDDLTREPPKEDHKGSNWWYLPATHFRLVTTEGNSHYPVAYLTYDWKNKQYTLNPAKVQDNQVQIADLLVGRQWKSAGTQRLTVDWVYVLPEDPSETQPPPKPDDPPVVDTTERPHYMVFRRICKVKLPTSLKDGMLRGLPPATPPGATTTPTQPDLQYLPLLAEPLQPR